MKSVIVGASAGLGRALAEELAARGHRLFLVASDRQDLEPQAQDLALRFATTVEWRVFDLATADPTALSAEATEALGGVDNLFLIAGRSSLSDTGDIPDSESENLLTVNLVSNVRLINAMLPELRAGAGNIVGAGSVVSIRPRRNNATYGAAKTGLEFYFGTLRHALAADSRCRVQFYRLGYLKTRMTFGQQLPFPALLPEKAATVIANNLGRDLGVAYLPAWWGGIALILRLVPWFVFRKLNI